MENVSLMLDKLAAVEQACGPIRGDLPLPMESTGDAGASAARAMLERNLRDKLTHGTQGQRDLSLNEAVQIIGAALGRDDVVYMQEKPEAARRTMLAAGISEHVTDLMLEVAASLLAVFVVDSKDKTPDCTGQEEGSR
jgi:hypothetical protein